MAEEVLHIIVSGRVQGVGFRYHVEALARICGVAGWVRNLPSGEVEILARVPLAARQRFVAGVQEGPPASRVEGLRISPAARPQECPAEGFSVRF